MNQRYQKKDAEPKVRPDADPGRIKLDYGKKKIAVRLDVMRQHWTGRPKIGKTVNANHAGAYFLECEPGHDHIEHAGEPIRDWVHFKQVCREVIADKRKDEFPFNKVCIDTLALCYRFAAAYICKKFKIMHESDLNSGKGYALIENEFRDTIIPLSSAGIGVIFISHTEDKELKDGQGEKYVRAVAKIPTGCKRVIDGMVDLLLFFDVVLDDQTQKMTRVIHTAPSQYHDAGIRYPDNWARRVPRTIPMSWDALVNAWNAGTPDGYVAAEPARAKPAPEPEQQQPPPQQQQQQPETACPKHPEKRGFWTEDRAIAAAKEDDLRHYKCDACDRFHLTSQEQRTQKQEQRPQQPPQQQQQQPPEEEPPHPADAPQGQRRTGTRLGN